MKISKEKRFKEIIEEHERLIHSICSYYCQHQEDRKDLYQEVLMNVWKSLDSFRGDAKISTWLYRVAVNTALSSSGKAFKYMKIMVHAEDRHLNLLFEDNRELELKRVLEKNLDELQVQINLLSVIDKALITLMLEGLSTREISEIIGLTESNVRVKIHRIKEQLKDQFAKNNIH